MKRIGTILTLPVAALLALVVMFGPATPAAAGGWVVVSLDESPEIVAGEVTDVGFTVLRHGVTPETSDDLQVVVTAPDGTLHRFAARPDGAHAGRTPGLTTPRPPAPAPRTRARAPPRLTVGARPSLRCRRRLTPPRHPYRRSRAVRTRCSA